MTSEQIRRVKRLLARVAGLPKGAIDEFLEVECPDDPEVRAEIVRLLSVETLDTSVVHDGLASSVVPQDGSDPIGLSVGPYRIVRRIGEGGMGVVYEAEQLAPIKRLVALKLIKWGMDTRQVVARFESERQALALMRHPNIAAVYDGGATEQGRPYFAMELVDGVPITRYCDEHRLTTMERLRLFAAVCEGVQHAHQKGIIHRDIKPTNVLVEEHDGKPVPKIIDFGVAKATEQRHTERTLLTELGQMIGTPEYMSPEQARPAGLDVDTRTDVYSLGVLLYELLVGALPFDARQLRSAGLDELLRRIVEDEPPKPSNRLSTLGGVSRESARLRSTDPSGLRRQLRGDLDWIAMRALEKERDRRYSSVSEFASDVQRHLRHEPISAGPPSVTYRMRKFVRRHRLGFAATVAVATAILAGAVLAMAGYLRAVRAERVALEKAATAESVTGFLVNLFELSDPGRASGNRVTARELLDRGAEQIANELADQPLAQSSMMVAMGQAYRGLGLFPEAAELLEGGVATQRERLDSADPRLPAGLLQLGELQLEDGRPAEAEATLREAMELTEAQRGPRHPDVGVTLRHLARALQAQAKYDEARAHLERSIELIESSLGSEHLEYALSGSALAWVLHAKGEDNQARELYDRLLPVFERVGGAESAELAWCLSSSAVVLTQLRELDPAQSRLLRAVEILESIYGPQHPGVATMLNNLGTVYWYRGMWTETTEVYERTLAIREHTLGADHPDLAGSLNNLGLVYRQQKRYDEAREAFDRAGSILRASLGEEHPRVANTLVNLGWVYRAQGLYPDAIRYYREALAIRERSLGPDHPEVNRVLEDLAGTYGYGMEDPSSALPFAERALAICREAFGEDHMRTRNAQALVAELRCREGNHAVALPILESFLADETERLGETHRAVGSRYGDLGDCLLRSGNPVAAREALERALQIHAQAGYRKTATAKALTNLGSALDRLGDVEAAERYLVEAIDLLEEQGNTLHHQYRNSVRAYDDFLKRHGRARNE